MTTTTLEPENNSRIYIPFTIGGGFSTAAFSFQLFLFIFHRYYTPPMYVDTENEEKIVQKQEKIFSTEFLTSVKFRLCFITGAFLGKIQN